MRRIKFNRTNRFVQISTSRVRNIVKLAKKQQNDVCIVSSWRQISLKFDLFFFSHSQHREMLSKYLTRTLFLASFSYCFLPVCIANIVPNFSFHIIKYLFLSINRSVISALIVFRFIRTCRSSQKIFLHCRNASNDFFLKFFNNLSREHRQ